MLDYFGQKLFCDGLMDKDRIERVAYAGSLCLGVVNDLHSGVLVGGVVHKEMADADAARDDGDLAVLAAELMQACAAARDDHVHVVFEMQKLKHQGTIGTVNELDGVCRDSALS